MIIITEKMAQTLANVIEPSTRFYAFEGPARSAKTATAIQSLFYSVYRSKEKKHLIAARDFDAIKNNILEAQDVGLLVTHPDCRLTKSSIGGNYVSMIGQDRTEKQILLANYSNKAAWKKVLGGSLGVVFIDEINIAEKDFINEAFARQLNAAHPLTICTLNGDDPQNFAYQNYINYSQIRGQAPASTIAEMTKFHDEHGIKPGYFYEFYGMADNPVMSREKLQAAMSIYPVGSFYYQTKILGERGVQGDLIFDEYLFKEQVVEVSRRFDPGTEALITLDDLLSYTIGVDIGATRASNCFVLTGWTAQYNRAVILDCEVFHSTGYAEKTAKLKRFLDHIRFKLGIDLRRINAVFVDSAEQNYIRDLSTAIQSSHHIPVVPSYKATIKDRIDMMIVGLSTKRIKFLKGGGEKVYSAYRKAAWVPDKKGKERLDHNEEHNDIMDAAEYSLTCHMKSLMRSEVRP